MFQRLKNAFVRFLSHKSKTKTPTLALVPTPTQDNVHAITFIHSVVALAAKFSQNDPIQTARQIEIFATVFPIGIEQKEAISLLFNEAYEDTLPALQHARRIMRAYNKHPNVLREVLDALVRFVLADRIMTARDMVMLSEIAEALGLRQETVLYYAEKVLIPEALSPYEILRVKKGVNAEELKKAYRIQARNCHPDRLGENVAVELKPLLAARFSHITRAYETLSRKPGRLLAGFFTKKVSLDDE